MATWTVYPMDVACGSCGASVPAGEPVQLLTERKLVRCVEHASEPVNMAEVDLEHARIEFDRCAVRATPAVASTPERYRPQGFRSLVESARPLFDSKRAALGKDAE